MPFIVSLLASTAVSGVLMVQRAPEALDCPDSASLSAMIARLTPRAPRPVEATELEGDRFELRFSRDKGRYRVTVRSAGAHAGVRTIEDGGATCASLAEATALAIAVIIDPEGVKLTDTTPEPPPPPPPEPVPVAPLSPTESKPESPASAPGAQRWSLALAAGGGGAAGVVRALAPLIFLAIELRPLESLSFEAGAIFIPTQSLALEPGSIDVWLLAGSLDGCVWPYARQLRIGACVGARGGAIHGEGRGYPLRSGASRPWLAASAMGAMSGPLVGPLRWSLRLGAVVPAHRESFGVDGAGVAYEAAGVGAIGTFGLSMTIR